MALVIDASVAFKWFVPEPTSDLALELLDQPAQFIAPELILVEVINAMWARLRGRDNFAQIMSDAATSLPGMLDMIAPAAELMPRALEMTIALNHALYDCLYLALAEDQNAQLVTADTKFCSKVSNSPFAGLAIPLEEALRH
jgi:predicted nucleic acid-binding protein